MASMRERSSGASETTWQVLYRHGGKQASKTFRDPKKAEKFRALVDLIGPDKAWAEITGGGLPSGLTVAQLAAQFLEHKARPGGVTPRTLADYRRDIANYVEPWFGHRAAESLDEADVQKWVDHMAKTLAPKSVADRHMLLHSMYQYGKAKSRRLVTHNPCLETELPKATKKPPKGTRVTEWRAILRAAAERNPDAHDLILFMGSIGWRWSEAAALCVDAVEDDGTHVWVDVVRVFRIIDNRQVLVDGAAKSEAGFRRSRLPREAGAMVRRRIVGKGPGDFVFTNSRGGHWNQNTFLRDTWPGLLKAAKVGSATRKPTPHWMRHMAVGVMARAGVPMHEIQRIIGHESVDTTNGTYGSMVTTLNSHALTNMDAILAGLNAPGEVVVGQVVGEISPTATP
ncbi:MAG: tyrosine-type recombinase/integrase [Mycobacteriaceae bacterium]